MSAISSPTISAPNLESLASIVIGRIRPNAGDRHDVEDCWQTAYLAGLQAVRSAEQKCNRLSTRCLILAMQSSVYRLLRKTVEICEIDLSCSC